MKDPSPSPPAGHARLAQRIAGWTTKGLLTAVIVVAALGFGRQVLVWWGEDKRGQAGPGLAQSIELDGGLGYEAQEHILQFGDHPWAVRRRVMAGTREQVLGALLASSREALAAAPRAVGAIGPSEAHFLQSIAGRKPVAEEPGKWQIFQLGEGFPMMAGVRLRASGSGGDAEAPGGQQPAPPPDASPPGTQVAEGGRRVVTWGLAVPAASQGWTLYTFQPAERTGGTTPELLDVPLPPESIRTLSMRVAGGGRMTAFQGPPQPETWMQFYNQWLRKRGWSAPLGWSEAAGAHAARFTKPGDPAAGAIDVRFGPDGRGGLSGLLMVTPAAREP